MDKQKKTLIIGGIVEGLLLVFDLIVSIIVWTTVVTQEELDAMPGKTFEEACVIKNGGFIGFFQANPTAFFCIICIPLFVIIAADFIYFAVLAAKKESNLSESQLEVIRQKAREQAEAELMAEMLGQQNQGEEAPAETTPEEK